MDKSTSTLLVSLLSTGKVSVDSKRAASAARELESAGVVSIEQPMQEFPHILRVTLIVGEAFRESLK